MKRVILLTATLALAGSMAAQTTPVPPPPPAQATPATPAVPAPAPRPRVRMYRSTIIPSAGSYLGVEARELTAARAKELRLNNDQGVEIVMVDQDSPAGKAGLHEGDVVVKFNGQAVLRESQLYRLIRETKPGTQVALGIVRDGQPQTVQVTLANRQKMYAHAMPMPPEPPPAGRWRIQIPNIDVPSFVMSVSSRMSGATVENLTPQLGDYFGVKDGQGVLVRSVDKGSKAEAAGLRAGDVIVRLDNERISGTTDWSRLLRDHEAGTVKLGIVRNRREQTLSMSVPEANNDNSYVIDMPNMEQLQREWARMGPEWQRQQAEIQSRIAKEMAAHQKEIQKAMQDAQRELQRSMREMQKEQEKAKAKADEEQ